jgi:hypothetical protein
LLAGFVPTVYKQAARRGRQTAGIGRTVAVAIAARLLSGYRQLWFFIDNAVSFSEPVREWQMNSRFRAVMSSIDRLSNQAEKI